jgi:hypothetical protein
MLKEIKNDVVVHTLDVRDRGTAVIAFNIIGKIVSCQDVYSHLKQRKPMTGLWRILSRFGVKNWERNEICFQRRNEWRARQDLNLGYPTSKAGALLTSNKIDSWWSRLDYAPQTRLHCLTLKISVMHYLPT